MRYAVLGPLEVHGPHGPLALRGRKQRLLLALLLAHAPRVVAADRLTDALWPHEAPQDEAAALQTQLSRLRSALRRGGITDAITGEGYGYRLAADRHDIDVAELERLVGEARTPASREEGLARLEEALALWRGEPYEEFADLPFFLGEAARLRELRTTVLELRAESLLALGRTADALVACTALVSEEPLRERPRALLMEALYRAGRPAEALATFHEYRRRLSEELGLQPSPALRQLELEILRHDRALAPRPSPSSVAGFGLVSPPATPAAPALRIAFAAGAGTDRFAGGEAGAGAALLVLPAWVSSLTAVAAGRDPRSPFLERLAADFRLLLYDRPGMGLSSGPVGNFTLEEEARDALAALDAAGMTRATVLALSQAGPPALALAARHPERVAGLVLLGTYASARHAFPREDVRGSILALVRAHWGIASKALADLIVPGATAEESQRYARMQREAATPEVATRALEHFYAADVTDLLADVRCPALVIHYRGDRAVPFRGGEEIAALLPQARFVPLEASSHLPRSEDIAHIVDLIHRFIAGFPPASATT